MPKTMQQLATEWGAMKRNILTDLQRAAAANPTKAAIFKDAARDMPKLFAKYDKGLRSAMEAAVAANAANRRTAMGKVFRIASTYQNDLDSWGNKHGGLIGAARIEILLKEIKDCAQS
jgi:hypothetical protein